MTVTAQPAARSTKHSPSRCSLKDGEFAELQGQSTPEKHETDRVAMTEAARQEVVRQAQDDASRRRQKDAETELWEAELAAYRHS
jgi:hypothetical protein